MTDPRGFQTVMRFDAVGHDIGSIDPLLRRVTLGYDPVGRQNLKFDPRGNRLTSIYDAASRLVGQRITCPRPNCGRIASQIKPVGILAIGRPFSRIGENFGEGGRVGDRANWRDRFGRHAGMLLRFGYWASFIAGVLGRRDSWRSSQRLRMSTAVRKS